MSTLRIFLQILLISQQQLLAVLLTDIVNDWCRSKACTDRI